METVAFNGVTARRVKPAIVTGPPMLFVHGYFVDGAVFANMMSYFAERGHECVAVNLRGRSGSRPGSDVGRASIADFADDAAEVARALGNPVVVGHSMGGLVAQVLAARGLARAVALFAPAPPRGIPLTTLRLAIAQLPYLPSILRSRPITPDHRELTAIAFNRVPKADLPALLATVVPDSGHAGREMSLTGVEIDASRVTVPMIVIGGDDDRFIMISRVRRVALRYGAFFRAAPGRGHMLIIEPGWAELAGWVEHWMTTIDSRMPSSPSTAADA
jgi:non-heme chloroperoxidase